MARFLMTCTMRTIPPIKFSESKMVKCNLGRPHGISRPKNCNDNNSWMGVSTRKKKSAPTVGAQTRYNLSNWRSNLETVHYLGPKTALLADCNDDNSWMGVSAPEKIVAPPPLPDILEALFPTPPPPWIIPHPFPRFSITTDPACHLLWQEKSSLPSYSKGFPFLIQKHFKTVTVTVIK